jgi:hypothetical protein
MHLTPFIGQSSFEFAHEIRHRPRRTPPLVVPLVWAQRSAGPSDQPLPVFHRVVHIPPKAMPAGNHKCIPASLHTILRWTRATLPVYLLSGFGSEYLRLL